MKKKKNKAVTQPVNEEAIKGVLDAALTSDEDIEKVTGGLDGLIKACNKNSVGPVVIP